MVRKPSERDWVGSTDVAMNPRRGKRRHKIVYINGNQDSDRAVFLGRQGYDVRIAYDPFAGLWAILEEEPDIILYDIERRFPVGLDLLRRVRALASPVGRVPFLIMAGSGNRGNAPQERELGADFVDRSIDSVRLGAVIRARLTRDREANLGDTPRSGALPALSDREVETLTWAARGKTSAHIALILGISKRTVDFHIDNARTKLMCATRIEAVIKAALGRKITL